MSYEKEARQLRQRVFHHMLQTRGWKYRAFLRYLRLFKYITFAPDRGLFLECYYTLMRYIDDVVDGDVPLPNQYPDEVAYVQEKIRFSKNPVLPQDEVDHLMVYCFEVGKRFGAEFNAETSDILGSLLFDARRKGKMILFPKEELVQHFHRLDIRGTISATLKIFKEDPEKYLFLEPLGTACRYQYDIEDFEADIRAGYVNISKEECDQFEIDSKELSKISSLKISRWLRYRAEEGMHLLNEHHRRLSEGKFSLLARATFLLVYELPARRVFRKVLSTSRKIAYE